jgi:uncharacterized RDD family membrane protein YckC
MKASGGVGQRSGAHPLNGPAPGGSPVVYAVEGGAVPEVVAGQSVLALAGAGRRAWARVVDGVVLAVGCVVLLLIVGEVSDLVDPSGDGAAGAGLFLLVLPVVCIAWGVRYHVEATWRFGRTLGKWVFGLKVLLAWSDGSEGLVKRAVAVREGARAFAAVVPVVNLVIGAVLLTRMVRERPYWQSKWDAGAETVVVRWPRRG